MKESQFYLHYSVQILNEYLMQHISIFFKQYSKEKYELTKKIADQIFTLEVLRGKSVVEVRSSQGLFFLDCEGHQFRRPPQGTKAKDIYHINIIESASRHQN